MHLATAGLAPSLGYLYWHWWKNFPKRPKAGYLALAVLGPIFTVTIFLLLIGLGPDEIFGFTEGTAFPFMPFVSESSAGFNYHFFSFSHLIDLLNLVLLISPFCIPLCLLLFGHKKILQSKIWFLILASFFPLGSLALFNPALGFPRDWDVFAFGLIAPSLLGIVTLIRVAGKNKDLLRYAGTVVIAVGLVHVVPWVLIQADEGRSLARYENLLAGEVLRSRYARSFGHEEIAVYYRERSRLSQAEMHYRKAIEADPDSYRLYAGLATVHSLLGQKDKALTGLLKMIELEPESLRAQFSLALFYQQEGKYAEAERHYQKVLEINPAHLPAVCNLGSVYFKQGFIDKAILLYRYVLEQDPADNTTRANLQAALRVKEIMDSAADSTSSNGIPLE